VVNPNQTNPNSLNYVKKHVVFYFAFLKDAPSISKENIMEKLETVLWGKHLSPLIPKTVICESLQLKIVFPREKSSGLQGHASGKPGKLDPRNHKFSPRAYILKLNSSFLETALDDHTLRFSFFSMINYNINAITNNYTNSSVIKELCQLFENPIILDWKTNGPETKKVELQLVIHTDRISPVYPFLALDRVYPLGFTAAARHSAVVVPIFNSDNGQ